MKIRDIQNFRFFYKTGVRKTWDKNRDENFIGSSVSSNGKTQFGFFDIYHGDKAEKEGIEGFLRGFLDMAQDSQAIYEFLQNAVDANSTTFEMYYDDDYFLAFNNGFQFDFEGIRSILNVGVSTKSQDSSNIGKFGIGFKLIHRLVGEKSGLEELTKLSGPILFSWGSSEQLKELQNFSQDDKIDFEKDYYKEIDNGKFINTKRLPWMFKILLTNFPCQPEEHIRNLKYQEVSNAFTKTEIVELGNWVKTKIKVDISKHNLNSGSLFFLRLGKNKGSKLSTKRIEDGIQFSLSILNNIAKFQGKQGISQIRVNESIFEAKRLFFERFIIKFGSNEYNQIKPQRRNEEDTSDIEVLIGFMDYKTALNEIKGNPNFYLFFPLSEEVHNISFIIHSTGFYNASQRTNLQGNESSSIETQGINEALLKVITEKIKFKLLSYYNDTAKDVKFRHRFLNIYSNLLLSNKATENHKNWVDNCLIEPIFDILKLQIPTQNGYSENDKNVKIKNTFLNISPADFGCPEIEWFVWHNEKYDKILIEQARSSEKLHLERWDILDLLKFSISKGRVETINEWVKQANEKHFAEAHNKDYTYLSFIKEIDENILERDLPYISQIKLFKFSDNNYYSLNEIFANPNLALIYDKTVEIKRELRYLGLVVSNLDISKNPNLLKHVLPKMSEETLFKAIAEKSKQNTLYPEQKHKLFFAVANFDRVGPEKLKDLELFKDSEGQIQPLRNLLKGTLQVPTWLSSFKINLTEYIAKLDEYLVKEKDIYKILILPNWASIIVSISDVVDFYAKVKYYFDLEEGNIPLKKQAFIFINKDEKFVTVDNVFYNSKFLQITNYNDIKSAILSLLYWRMPDKSILSYFSEVPFEIKNVSFSDFTVNNDSKLSLEEIKSLLVFCKSNNENFFQKFTIEKKDKAYYVSPKIKGIFQVFPSKEARSFIENNLADSFKILPYELDEYKDENGVLYREPFYHQLIESIDVDDFKAELVDIVVYDEPKRKLLLQLSEIRLVSGEQYNKESFEYKILNFACDSKIIREADYSKFREKIRIETSDATLELLKIPTSNDDVVFENGKHKLSLAQILPNSFQNSDFLTNIIRHFSDLGIQRQQLETLFDISKEVDINRIFSLFEAKIENVEQLAFIILYNNNIENIDFSKFEVKAHNESYYSLNYNYSIKSYPFIRTDEILHSKYNSILDRLKEDSVIQIGVNQIYKEPYFINDTTFFYPSLVTEWIDETRLSLLDFLFFNWKKNKKTAIQKIDWTSISSKPTIEILSFNPHLSVYPSKFVIEAEKLPKYLTDWIEVNERDDKLKFLYDFGVSTSTSLTVKLRQYFQDGGEFIKSQIKKEGKEALVFNTFEWMKANKIVVLNDEAYTVFVEMKEFINGERKERKAGDLIVETNFDFEKLNNDAEEWTESFYENWTEKINNKHSIYLYSGKLPKAVSLNEISDYVFRVYSEGDITVKGKSIYVNSHKDIETLLYTLVGQELMSSKDLLELYQTKNEVSSDNEVETLKNEVSRLRDIIENLTKVSGTASYSPTVSHDDYHDEIKEKSEKFLYLYLQKEHKNNVVWLNGNEDGSFSESWKNHDFQILDDKGNVLNYIDCKGTPANKKTIYLTQNEWDFFLKNTDNYQIYRIFNIDNTPRVLKIDNLLDWLLDGRIVPYLLATEQIKGGRVFLTIQN